MFVSLLYIEMNKKRTKYCSLLLIDDDNNKMFVSELNKYYI